MSSTSSEDGNDEEQRESDAGERDVIPSTSKPTETNGASGSAVGTKKKRKRKILTLEDYEKMQMSDAGKEAHRREQERLELLAACTTAISNPFDFEIPSYSAHVDEPIGGEDGPEVIEVNDDSDDEIQCLGTVVKPYNPHATRSPMLRPIVPPSHGVHTRAPRPRRNSEEIDKIEMNDEKAVLISLKGEKEVLVARHLNGTLQPHQFAGVKFLYDNLIVDSQSTSAGLGCILAHSMGLGKTIQVITFTELFVRMTKLNKVLVICPVNVIQNWANEFDMWLPLEGPDGYSRPFAVHLLGDSVKGLEARAEFVKKWESDGGVLLIGYEMFRMLVHLEKRSVKKNETNGDHMRDLTAEFHAVNEEARNRKAELVTGLREALLNPGPDLVVCDEGHRIKNLKTEAAIALNAIRTRRRIVLTGYPLQNNLLEYYCMIDFVRPNHLDSRKKFITMFERPIKKGQAIDSTPSDIKIAKQRTHVLISMLKGFVQRRSQHLLKKILPQSLEYVLLLKKSPIQCDLYRAFVAFATDEMQSDNLNSFNPLKAFHICSKILNHPDLLYRAILKRRAEQENKQAARVNVNARSPYLSDMNEPNGGFSQMDEYRFLDSMIQSSGQSSTQSASDVSNSPFHNGDIFTPGFLSNPTPSPSTLNGYSHNVDYPLLQPSFRANQLIAEHSNGENGYGAPAAKKQRRKAQSQTFKLDPMFDDEESLLEDNTINYAWAEAAMQGYVDGLCENGTKMLAAFSIIEECMKRGEKLLLFSGSVLTLDLFEGFLNKQQLRHAADGEPVDWRRNVNYCRFDGSTSGETRERLINRFNTEDDLRLFLISTRAGSLGVNLVSASRVIIFDVSWNPCHDAQAVCRIYRYGQKRETRIYRLVMENSMEKAIFNRQISKHGLQQRVIDQQDIDVNVTSRELENLLAYDESADRQHNLKTEEWDIADELLKSITTTKASLFAAEPFLHESLLHESEATLSNQDKQEAEQLYNRELRGGRINDLSGGYYDGEESSSRYSTHQPRPILPSTAQTFAHYSPAMAYHPPNIGPYRPIVNGMHPSYHQSTPPSILPPPNFVRAIPTNPPSALPKAQPGDIEVIDLD